MRVRFAPRTGFAKELNRRVAAHFKDLPAASIRSRMWGKTATILAWFVASYGLLVFVADTWWQVVPLAVSLGLSMAAIGFNIQHDANHGAYPAPGRVGRLLGYSLDLLGTSSYVWRFQHNVDHHTYTNIDRADADIDVGIFARLSPKQRRRSFHRYQHLYIWLLYSLYVLQWMFWSEWRDLARSKIGENPFPPLRGRELAGFIAGKAASLILWFGPLAFCPVAAYFGTALLVVAVFSLVLAVVFQLAHVVDSTAFPETHGDPPRSQDEWVVHQLSTTTNFGTGSRLLTWCLGGLNLQVEHHLFPRVCHLHYPSIAPIVRATCREFGVVYHEYATFGHALRSHYRWLREMGARPSEAVSG